mmetsp:Transcript_70936/g.151861  ORF Transcript_70936/g.151861 Transcript_70936/m.151861 type:complete len:248 (+) Transcript_70936:121-864(+)
MDEVRAEARRRWEEQQQGRRWDEARPSTAGAPSAPAASDSGGGPRTADPGVGQEIPFLDQLMQQWAALSQEQQRQAIAVGVVLLAILFVGARVVVPSLALSMLVLYLHSRLPREASFDDYFRGWFTQEYFPKVSQKLQRELQERSQKQSNIFDSMASQFKGWVMGKTESLQAMAWYEMAVKHALPATFRDLFFMRTATVNVGSRRQPCIITFWGINERWMLAPYITLDLENTSVLEEIERPRPQAGR